MSIIGIDIGSSTTKIVEYKNDEIINKKIIRNRFSENDLNKFVEENNIVVEQIILTGIGADKVKLENYDLPTQIVDEFSAIATGGLVLTDKKEAIVISVGTGTAFIEVKGDTSKHLGGTGIGAGTLFNICNRILNINSFDEIVELAKKGNVEKIDLRIGDITDSEIETLPKDLTLSNFGKFDPDSKKEDIVIGLINMIFEVIGMMTVFITAKSEIKEAVLIGNITVIPGVEYVLRRIEKVQNIKFTVPNDTEFGVVLGAIKKAISN